MGDFFGTFQPDSASVPPLPDGNDSGFAAAP
jgi:hypothetical protein